MVTKNEKGNAVAGLNMSKIPSILAANKKTISALTKMPKAMDKETSGVTSFGNLQPNGSQFGIS